MLNVNLVQQLEKLKLTQVGVALISIDDRICQLGACSCLRYDSSYSVSCYFFPDSVLTSLPWSSSLQEAGQHFISGVLF